MVAGWGGGGAGVEGEGRQLCARRAPRPGGAPAGAGQPAGGATGAGADARLPRRTRRCGCAPGGGSEARGAPSLPRAARARSATATAAGGGGRRPARRGEGGGAGGHLSCGRDPRGFVVRNEAERGRFCRPGTCSPPARLRARAALIGRPRPRPGTLSNPNRPPWRPSRSAGPSAPSTRPRSRLRPPRPPPPRRRACLAFPPRSPSACWTRSSPTTTGCGCARGGGGTAGLGRGSSSARAPAAADDTAASRRVASPRARPLCDLTPPPPGAVRGLPQAGPSADAGPPAGPGVGDHYGAAG
jgi:hypothetical protein